AAKNQKGNASKISSTSSTSTKRGLARKKHDVEEAPSLGNLGRRHHLSKGGRELQWVLAPRQSLPISSQFRTPKLQYSSYVRPKAHLTPLFPIDTRNMGVLPTFNPRPAPFPLLNVPFWKCFFGTPFS